MLSALGVWALASVDSTDRATTALEPRATSLSLEHVLFGVMTSGVNSRRAWATKATWCGAAGIKCVFFSETAETAKEVQPVVAFYDIGSDYKSAQLKFLPALQFLKTHPDFRSGKVQWVMLVDDDTFVLSRNLMLTLDQFGAGTTRYIGHTCPEAVVKKRNGGPSHDFVMGGGGSLLSRLALEKMDIQACITRQNSTWRHWQSDWMIGACAAEAGIKAENDQRFHQWLSWEGPGPRARAHNFGWAVTLHPAHPNHMLQLGTLRADINDVPVLDAGQSPGDPENSPDDPEYWPNRGGESGNGGDAMRDDGGTFDTTGSDETPASIASDSEEAIASDAEAPSQPATDAEVPLASSPDEGAQRPAPTLHESSGWLEGVSGRRHPPDAPSAGMMPVGDSEQADGGGAPTAGTGFAARTSDPSTEPASAAETGATSADPLDWTPRLMQQGASPSFQMPEPEQHAAAAHATRLELLDLEQKALQRSGGHAPRHMISLVQKRAGREAPSEDGPQTFVVVIK